MWDIIISSGIKKSWIMEDLIPEDECAVIINLVFAGIVPNFQGCDFLILIACLFKEMYKNRAFPKMKNKY